MKESRPGNLAFCGSFDRSKHGRPRIVEARVNLQNAISGAGQIIIMSQQGLLKLASIGVNVLPSAHTKRIPPKFNLA